MTVVLTTKNHFSGGFDLTSWEIDCLDGERDKLEMGDLLTEELAAEAFLDIGFARCELDGLGRNVIYEGPCHFEFGFMDDVLGNGDPNSAPCWKVSFDEVAASCEGYFSPNGAAVLVAELRALADKIEATNK